MIAVGECEGFALFFLHTSYNCPALKLWGYATETALRRAVKRTLRKRGQS